EALVRDEREVVEREPVGAGAREAARVVCEVARPLGRPVRRRRRGAAVEKLLQRGETPLQLVSAERAAADQDGVRGRERGGTRAAQRRLGRRPRREDPQLAPLRV